MIIQQEVWKCKQCGKEETFVNCVGQAPYAQGGEGWFRLIGYGQCNSGNMSTELCSLKCAVEYCMSKRIEQKMADTMQGDKE